MSLFSKLRSQLFYKSIAYPSLWHEMFDFLRLGFILGSSVIFVCGLLVPLSGNACVLLSLQLIAIYSIFYKKIIQSLRIILFGASISAIALTAYWSVCNTSSDSKTPITTLPSPRTFPWLNSALKEEDGVYLGLRFLSLIYGVTPNEYRGLQPTLEHEYKALRLTHGDFPTPLIATLFGGQSSSSFDLISFPPTQNSSDKSNEKKAVIFLHGVGGNWSLLCWIISQSVASQGYYTFCPSKGALEAWNSSTGSNIFSITMEKLHKEGFSKIYLSGISAGAVGAVPLASQYQRALQGLVLISGIAPGITDVPLKTLLITAKGDERFTPEIVQWVMRREKGNLSKIEHHWIEGDHLAIVKKKTQIQELIGSWLKSADNQRSLNSPSRNFP